jgi:hypothetical protein
MSKTKEVEESKEFWKDTEFVLIDTPAGLVIGKYVQSTTEHLAIRQACLYTDNGGFTPMTVPLYALNGEQWEDDVTYMSHSVIMSFTLTAHDSRHLIVKEYREYLDTSLDQVVAKEEAASNSVN